MTNLENLQQNILEFRNKYKNFPQGNKNPNYSLNDAIFCAEDFPRNKKFYEAINKAVKVISKKTNNKIIADLGSGTGILGIMALLNGADKVYFVEKNQTTSKLSKRFMQKYYPNFLDKSIFLCEDAKSVNLPEKISILISETITTAFVQEDFPQIILNAKKFCNPDCIIIPQNFKFFFNNLLTAKKNFSLEISSAEIMNGKNLEIPKGKYKVSSQIFLYQEINIKSGESISFGNQRILEK